MLPSAKGEDREMRLESETRKLSTLEQHFVHGRWEIVRIYVRGVLREIQVKYRDEWMQ